MRVAIVHYHLETGGITSVVKSASLALTHAGIRHVILSSSPPHNIDPALRQLTREIPALSYHTATKATVHSLLDDLLNTATHALGCRPDVWHFHNHSLGKNPLVGHLVAHLAAMGERLLLQLHDLAEEGRPENYPALLDCPHIYPLGPNIHYGFLNSRDRTIFSHAGLPSEESSIIINPIPHPTTQEAPSSIATPLVFAPIRAIRRKNIGEIILLAALAPPSSRFAISRAPQNPHSLPIYQNWQNFALRHLLPVHFNVVDHHSPLPHASPNFASWIEHSTHFISTSVAEGFGLPFLEAIARRKPLLGRNLPHITSEHSRHGIFNPLLYEKILIPIDWIERTILESHFHTTWERNLRHYRQPLDRANATLALEALIHGENLDFGNLPEPLQQSVIERLITPGNLDSPHVLIGHQKTKLTAWLEQSLAHRLPHAPTSALLPFSPEEYLLQIQKIYQTLIAANTRSSAPQPSHLTPAQVLQAHLTPERFHFLLSTPAPPIPKCRFRAVIFDIYGTLLIAPPGSVKPDPLIDPVLRQVLREHGYHPPESPSTALYQAVQEHHAESPHPHPEVDLCKLWRKILHLESHHQIAHLVHAIEDQWHPAQPMPGALQAIQNLSRLGISLGLLSNAQCNTLSSLGPITDLFAPELCILSYQHGMAKPSPRLFEILAERLEGRGIRPNQTLFIGNDPLQDITPAASAGFRTALFSGHPTSIRPGACKPDHTLHSWTRLQEII